MRRTGRRAPVETSRVGRIQRLDPQRVGGHEELGRAVGRRQHGGGVSQGVRQLSIVGTSGHRGDRVRGARDGARGARRDRRGGARDHRLPRVALALLIATLFACDRRGNVVHAAPPPPAEEPFTSIDSPSLQFLPRQQEAGIWKLDEDPIVVPGDRLATYLGPDSARYAHYGVLDTTVGKYSGTSDRSFATVEIYRFPDFVKAFGAYSMHKEGPSRILPIANESFAGTRSINIWRGPFYVRILGTAQGDALLRLATFVADRMPPAPGRPAVFGFLPDKGRVANSERYSADAVFGQP